MNSELLDKVIKSNDDFVNMLLDKEKLLMERFNKEHINQGIDEAFSTKGILFAKYIDLYRNPEDSDEYTIKLANLNSLLQDYEDFSLYRTELIVRVINDYCNECGAEIQAFDNAFDEVRTEIERVIAFKMDEENKLEENNKHLVLNRWCITFFFN